MTDFTYVPDSIDESAEFSVQKMAFGDGYTQRVPNGINTALRKWTVTFSDRSKTEADAIRDFFVLKGGATSFTCQLQGFSSDLRVVCPRYSRPIANRYVAGSFVYSVKADFEETPL